MKNLNYEGIIAWPIFLAFVWPMQYYFVGLLMGLTVGLFLTVGFILAPLLILVLLFSVRTVSRNKLAFGAVGGAVVMDRRAERRHQEMLVALGHTPENGYYTPVHEKVSIGSRLTAPLRSTVRAFGRMLRPAGRSYLASLKPMTWVDWSVIAGGFALLVVAAVVTG